MRLLTADMMPGLPAQTRLLSLHAAAACSQQLQEKWVPEVRALGPDQSLGMYRTRASPKTSGSFCTGSLSICPSTTCAPLACLAPHSHSLARGMLDTQNGLCCQTRHPPGDTHPTVGRQATAA